MRGIESMAYPLPEDIQVRVHAGDFAGALGLIDIYVKEGIAPLLNDRLELERQRIERMSANYPYTRLQAISMAQAGIPGLTDAEFDFAGSAYLLTALSAAPKSLFFINVITRPFVLSTLTAFELTSAEVLTSV